MPSDLPLIPLIKAMVIGDGCLALDKRWRGSNARLQIAHGLDQQEYLFWKAALLQRLGFRITYYEYRSPKSPTVTVAIQTNRDSTLTPVYSLMYPKLRGFEPGVLDDLDERCLAIIYMDDGCRRLSKKIRWSNATGLKSCESKP